MGAGLLVGRPSAKSLEQFWLDRAAALNENSLRTETWEDLRAALDCLADGDRESTLSWVEETEANFLAVWEEYESFELYEDEITCESVLGHVFLRDGVELWLEAVEMLRAGAEPDQVLERAEQGQRLLVTVQAIERAARDTENRFFANWN